MATKKRKKKRGHVAIPFLLAFLLGIVGIGGIAMYLFNRLSGPAAPRQMSLSITKPTEENNVTLMFVLDEAADACPLTFVAANINPAEKKITLVSLPSNMLALVDERQDTLTNFYRTGGVQGAMNAIQNEAGIYADRYVILNSESFQKICNIFAGVEYQVPLGTEGFADNSEKQYLGPSQIEKLVTNPFFEDGENERSAMVCDVLSEMINQTDYDRIVASMDSSFRTLINMMNTNISSIDYTNEKEALKYMYTYGTKVCTYRLATGSTSEDDVFVLDRDFKDKMKDIFGSANSSIQAAPVPNTPMPAPTEAATEPATLAEGETLPEGTAEENPVEGNVDENGEEIPAEENPEENGDEEIPAEENPADENGGEISE